MLYNREGGGVGALLGRKGERRGRSTRCHPLYLPLHAFLAMVAEMSVN